MALLIASQVLDGGWSKGLTVDQHLGHPTHAPLTVRGHVCESSAFLGLSLLTSLFLLEWACRGYQEEHS